MDDPTASHRARAEADPVARSVRCAIVTVSDTRTPETDVSGVRIQALLHEAGHEPCSPVIVRDEPDAIRAQLDVWIDDASVQVILSTGGTGIGRRDTTIEVVRDVLTAELEGFGELFRMLSYKQIGAAAMLSRATAGLVARDDGDTFIFAMPGSPHAVDLAMRELVLPEISHFVWARR